LFAVSGRGEQAVDESLVGVGSSIGQEAIDGLGCGGKSVEVKAESAYQGSAVGMRGWGEATGLPQQEKRIDRVRCRSGWQLRLQWAKGPEIGRLVASIGPVVGLAATGGNGDWLAGCIDWCRG
jgi:hypothetical protein